MGKFCVGIKGGYGVSGSLKATKYCFKNKKMYFGLIFAGYLKCLFKTKPFSVNVFGLLF